MATSTASARPATYLTGIMAALFACVTVFAQSQDTPDRNPFQPTAENIQAGMVAFRANCAYCHGMDARGMRGPDLTTGTWTHGGSDTELAATISTGVPGTAMPPNKLTEEEIWQIITFLRTLQQPPAVQTAMRVAAKACSSGRHGVRPATS